MPGINLPNYEDLGFDKWMKKPLSFSSSSSTTGSSRNMSELNFDQVQMSGGLGDKIQIGNILLDGSSGRITMDDGNGNIEFLLGKDYE